MNLKIILLTGTSCIFPFVLNSQDCTDLFISEYVEGSSQNKAIEIYNPTPNAIPLDDYVLKRYANGETTTNYIMNLLQTGGPTHIQPNDVIVITNGQVTPNEYGSVSEELYNLGDLHCSGDHSNSPMYFNGNDAVTLERKNGTIVDLFGKVGQDPGEGWTNITDSTIIWYPGGVETHSTIVNYAAGDVFWIAWTQNHTLVRKPAVKKGVKSNPILFKVHEEYDSLPENFYDSLGFHTCQCETAMAKEDPGLPEKEFFCYPNPVLHKEFIVKGTDLIESVELYNALGQVVKQQHNAFRRGDLLVSIPELREGLYLVKVNFAGHDWKVGKIMVR
jgi:hypothetical protein